MVPSNMPHNQPSFAEVRFAEAEAAFASEHPGYGAGSALDGLRASDYARLDGSDTSTSTTPAAGCYAESQIGRHHELLATSVLGNPHSHNPTSLASTAARRARRATPVFEFFAADPAEYDVIFTANASGALKLVGESYPFGRAAATC